MAGPFVNPEDTRVQLSNGNSLIFFHTGTLSEIQEQLNMLELTYGAISWGANDPDPAGDVYYIEIDQTSGQQVAGSHAQLVNTADQYHSQYNAKTLAFDDGSFVVVWSQSQGGGSFATCYQRFDAEGNTLGQNVVMQTMDDPIDTHQLTRDDSGSNGFNISIGRTGEAFHVASQDFGSPSSDIGDGWEDYPAIVETSSLSEEDVKYISGLKFLFGVGLRDGSDISVRIDDGSVDLYRIGYNPDRIIHVDRGLLGKSYTDLSNVQIWTFGNKGILGVNHKNNFFWRTIELEDKNEIRADETGVTYGEINAIPYSALENVRLNVFKSDGSETDYSDAKFILENISTGAASKEVDIFSVLSVHAPDFFPPSGAETVELGSSSDTFIGSANDDIVKTGGGSDNIFAGAGSDTIIVQSDNAAPGLTNTDANYAHDQENGSSYDGYDPSNDDHYSGSNGYSDATSIDLGTRTDPMSGETVSDGDADTVQVESTFSGTLLIKNTGSTDKVVVDQQTGPSEVLENGDWVINLSDGSTITIENYLTYDEASDMHVASGAYLSNQGYYPYDLGFGDMSMTGRVGSHQTDDLLYAVSYEGAVDEDTVYFANGRGGDDVIHGGYGTQQFWGGEGVDKFYLSSDTQSTLIIGDREEYRNEMPADSSNRQYGELPIVASTDTDFGDSVYLGWLESEVTLKELYGPGGNNYFRIETNDGQSVVDLYDVEKLYFSDYVDEQDFKALTNGRVIGKEDWFGAANGVDIDYHQANVSFEIDGSIIRVKASGSAIVTEEMFETETLWDIGGNQYKQSDYPSLTLAQWQGYGGVVVDEYEVSLGIQTYEKVFEDELIWEGERTEVDYFNFAGDVDVNVVNVSPEDTAGDPIFGAPGTTDGIDLVFGTADADFIDGRGGDDIIFGGGGDDVIIGGDGDDVIIGGDGSDILRGDSIDSNDAAYAAWQAGIAEFNAANPDNTVTFDENMLSIDNSGTNAGDGNDVIVGGDGLDDIKSGDGQNFVTSGKADIDGDGQANLDLINQNIENHQHLLDDEDWV